MTAPTMQLPAPPFEDILQTAQRKNLRLIGFCASMPRMGVSTCVAHSAKAAVRAGFKTMFIDASKGDESPLEGGWHPISRRTGCLLHRSSEGFDYVKFDSGASRRHAFNNLAATRAPLFADFEDYDFVFVDLPPMLRIRSGAVNPHAAAGLCEAVFLVVGAGVQTHAEIEATMSRLRLAGSRVEGIILNALHHDTPGEALALRAERWARWFPRLSARVARVARRSEVLA